MARIGPIEGVLGLAGLALLAWVLVAPAPAPQGQAPAAGATGATGADSLEVEVAALAAGASGEPVAMRLGDQEVTAQVWPVGAEPPHYQGALAQDGSALAVTVLPEGLQGVLLRPDGAFLVEPTGPGRGALQPVAAEAARGTADTS